jgi:hypothetical protein
MNTTIRKPTKQVRETGNIGGRYPEWFLNKKKNLPPKTSISSDDELTPLNSFESYVLGITPAQDQDWQI